MGKFDVMDGASSSRGQPPDRPPESSRAASHDAVELAGSHRPNPLPAIPVAVHSKVGAEDEINLFEFASVLLRRWRLILGLPFLGGVVGVAVALVIPPKYEATTSFLPESDAADISLPSGIAGLASQFGVTLPGASGNSPQFYADVLRSRRIMDAALTTEFADPRAPTQRSALVDILRARGETEARRLEEGRKALAKRMSIDVEGRTDVVTIAVETRYPEISAGIVNRFVELLNRFNMDTRQSSARTLREFMERRVAEAEREVLAVEGDLKAFLEANRQFASSPELQFQHDRLQRQLRIKEEVLTALRSEYEEARIQEVNDTPLLTIIDVGVPPARKSSPRRSLFVLMAVFLSSLAAIFLAFGTDRLDQARVRGDDRLTAVARQWSETKGEVRSILRPRSRTPPVA